MVDLPTVAPPRPFDVPAFAVARPRLERRLDGIRPGDVGLVVAPAGSGKSVLLSQWSASRPDLAVRSVTLARAHDDAVVLAATLLGVLEAELGDDVRRLGDLLAPGGGSLGEPFVDEMLSLLGAAGQDTVLVLDDLHAITNGGILGDLDRMVARLPPVVRVILGSRRDPPVDLVDLRLRGQLVELRADHLAFDDREAHDLLVSVVGREVGAADVRTLVERTDGWAVGLQLAGVALRDVDDVSAFVREFAGDDRLVVEYLTKEVLGQLDAPTRRFLLSTSVLPWLTAGLCDAVVGDGNSQEMLASLASRSLFLVPLDRAGTRYRYHHLFAELLVWELRIARPAAEVELRRAAAAWLRANGNVAEAAEQLIAAGETAAVLDLIAQEGHRFFERGEAATLARWLGEITRRDQDVPPGAMIDLLAAQTAAFAYVAGAETHRRLCRRRDLTPGERVAADGLYACFLLDDLPTATAIEVSERVLAALPGIDPAEVTDFLGMGGAESVEFLASFSSAFARFLQGDVGAATGRFRSLLAVDGTRYPVWQANALGGTALVGAWAGRLGEAEGLARGALAVASEADLSTHPCVAQAHVALAVAALERHDLGAAVEALGAVGLLVQRSRRRLLADVEVLLRARLDTACGDLASAVDRLRRPTACVTEPELLAVARRRLEVQLLLATGEVARARTVLDDVGDARPGRAAVDVELAAGEVAAARLALDRWTPDPLDVAGTVEHRIRSALVLEAEDDAAGSRSRMEEAVAAAEVEALRRPFLEVPGALRLLRAGRHGRLQPFVDGVLVASAGGSRGARGNAALIDPLTDRELALLDYLPSRMTNADIAAALYVSVNTVKTHVRNIYRKLEVPDRDGAVARATELGLL